jgi:hypothetical protein
MHLLLIHGQKEVGRGANLTEGSKCLTTTEGALTDGMEPLSFSPTLEGLFKTAEGTTELALLTVEHSLLLVTWMLELLEGEAKP